MNEVTTSPVSSSTSAPANRRDALGQFGIELAKSDKVHGVFALVQREDGTLELRNGTDTIAVYKPGQIVTSPSGSAAPALVLRKDKDGSLKSNTATPEEAKAQSLSRIGYAVLQLLSISAGSPFTPKGSKSDKPADRVNAVRELSISGLRSK
jgi:hypothetical protein